MTYLKLLTALTALVLLTACGGSGTPANNNGEEMSDNDKTDEMPDDDKTDEMPDDDNEPVVDPCASGGCVDVADLPTHPTTPAENDPVGTAFASGFLRVTLNPLAEGTPLLNPSGTENSTIDLTPFPTGTVVREEDFRFGRRGGLGSIDDDGFVNFRLLKAGAGGESTRSSVHSAILPTTSLGAPLASQPMTALWPGHYYPTRGGIRPANFYITFDTSLSTGVINFANIAGDGIGAGDTRQDFVKSLSLILTAAFDANGVITGTFSQQADFLIGAPILGLIGTEGLVAAASSGTGAAGFTATNPDGGAAPVVDPCIAGLVADNCVNTAAWESSFASGGDNESTTSPLRDSGFTNAVITTDTVRGTSDYIKLDGDNKIVTSGGTFNTNILRLNETANQDGYESGFAYAHDNTNSTGQTYAGILATTNLGAPLIDDSKDGTWTGRLAGITGVGDSLGSDTAAFSLKVTFGGDSDVAGSAGTIKTEGTNGFASIDGSSGGIRLIGDFNAAGVMWGRMNLGGAVDDNGTFSGLIGAKGAVGVFEGVNPAFSFAGGFEVKPPAPSSP